MLERPVAWVQRAAPFLAVASWLVIAVLSLVPGEDRPHTGASGNVEHAVAYCIAAWLSRTGFPGVRSRWHVLAFSAAAGLFEVAQVWIPGRSPGADNWAASTGGALLGITAARWFAHRVIAGRHRA